MLPAYWLVDCTFSGNTAAGHGGAIVVAASTFRHIVMLSATLMNNVAVGARGSAAHVSAPKGFQLYMVDSVLRDDARPSGADRSVVHVARDVAVTLWDSIQMTRGTGNRDDPVDMLDARVVTQDGHCNVGWVMPAISMQECERCREGGFSWWPGEALTSACHRPGSRRMSGWSSRCGQTRLLRATSASYATARS